MTRRILAVVVAATLMGCGTSACRQNVHHPRSINRSVKATVCYEDLSCTDGTPGHEWVPLDNDEDQPDYASPLWHEVWPGISVARVPMGDRFMRLNADPSYVWVEVPR